MADNSTRPFIPILLFVAALFVAMNRIVTGAPLIDWWLVLALLALGVLVAYLSWSREQAAKNAEVEAAAAAARAHELAALEAVRRVEEEVSAHVQAQQQLDAEARAQIHEAYDSIRDSDVRADAMASAAILGTREERETRGLVQNVSEVGATGEFHEVDEIAGTTDAVPVVYEQPKTAEPAVTAPQEMPIVPSAEADDLTKIEGIGPKMAAALNAAGITTFAQLAGASEADIRAAVQAAGMNFAPSLPTWPQQAAYAMRGDWDGFKTYVATLGLGRRKASR